LCIASFPSSAQAVTLSFSGTWEAVCGHADAETAQCDGLGLGLGEGDAFTGSLTYTEQGTATALSLDTASQHFDAAKLMLVFEPYDGVLSLFGIGGALSGGRYLAVSLTSGDPTSTSLPQSLSCSEWYLCGIQINDTGEIPFGEQWQQNIEVIEALNLGNTEADVFAFQPTPEPSTVMLILGGVFGFWASQLFRRMYVRRGGRSKNA